LLKIRSLLDHVQCCIELDFQHVVKLQWEVEWCSEMTWRRKVLDTFNIVEPSATGHMEAKDWPSMARVQHASTGASVAAGEAEREDSLWIMGDTWLILIGCLDFYHLNNFNSIISLEIIFYFYFFTKVHIFFLYK